MKFGAVHTPPPSSIRPLAARASLGRMNVPTHADHFVNCPADRRMLGNDFVGNCVPVANFRLIETIKANSPTLGVMWALPRELVMARYRMTGGYVDGRPETDRGTDTASDLLNWCAAPIVDDGGAEWPVYWATLRPDEHGSIAIALSRLPLLATLMLPEAAADDMLQWGMAPDDPDAPGWAPEIGHRVLMGGFSERWYHVRSWGRDVHVHPEFWARYAVAVDAVIPHADTGEVDLDIAGLDYAALAQDARMAGVVV